MANKSKFYFNGELVEPEKYVWEAHYNDGTALHQFDERDNSFHQFREIDQSKLSVFRMVLFGLKTQFFDLHFDSSTMKLIHFYKVLHLNVGTPQTIKAKLYCFGYEKKRVVSINIILPDGGLLITDRKDFVVNFNIV